MTSAPLLPPIACMGPVCGRPPKTIDVTFASVFMNSVQRVQIEVQKPSVSRMIFSSANGGLVKIFLLLKPVTLMWGNRVRLRSGESSLSLTMEMKLSP